jgi:hypothetical protein
MQAQTVQHRISEASATWSELDELVETRTLPERAIDTMFDAVLGYRIRRSTYLTRTGVEEQTATRDLAALASAGVLTPHGNGRGRFYTAGTPLQEIQQRRRSLRRALVDPYPWLRARLIEPGFADGPPS